MAGNTLLHDLLKNVNSEDSLLVFIAALVKDRQDAVVAEKENPSSTYGPVAGGWENTSIESFLEAAAAWAESTHFGLYKDFLQTILGDDSRLSFIAAKSTSDTSFAAVIQPINV